MTFPRLLACSLACLALSACSSTFFPEAPQADRGSLERLVRQAAERGTLVEGSVLRDSQKVFLTLHVGSGEKETGDLYLQADCTSKKTDWLFADLVDAKSSPIKRERRYGKGDTHSEPVALNSGASEAIFQLAAVKAACERTPSWREVAYNKKNDTQLLLEISSLKKQPDGSLSFWTAVDYPYLAYIRLSKAPYTRRGGFYQVDCTKQTYSLQYVYYLDQQQTVTDGGAPGQSSVLNIWQATGDSATLLSTVCGDEDLPKVLLPPEPRSKQLPDFATLPEPDTGIVKQLSGIRRASPTRKVGYMRIEGVRTPTSGSAAARLSKTGVFSQDIVIEPTQTPGVFQIARREGDDKIEQASYIGLIPLSQTLKNAEMRGLFTANKLETRGDWESIPVEGQLGYTQRMRTIDSITNQSNGEMEVICRVSHSIPAANLYPQLQGNAKELNCNIIENKDDEISTYYYLENYGFAVLLSSTSGKFSMSARIVEIR